MAASRRIQLRLRPHFRLINNLKRKQNEKNIYRSNEPFRR